MQKAMLVAMLVCGVLLMGCGKGSYETWPEKWDEEATFYFNEHVPHLRSLPGKIYHYQVTKYQSGNAEFFANSLYIDGKLVLNDLPNAAHKVGGVSAGQLEGMHIFFSSEEGYKVTSKYELPESLHEMLMKNQSGFFRDYL
ncbi:hypothetical protein [Stutzerimonas nitrititolerans]|uniref:hypothetical protein n=1 Tax=Stutzerimonas nitrititolerans TaxID=2482751 RepID=UPI0028A5D33C|nr:hypothetical protein [Stutzerimonas nitrititolerans]